MESKPHLQQRTGRKKKQGFLSTLRYVLEADQPEKPISWSDNGESIQIHNSKFFRDTVLPLFKGCPDLKSFVKQLILNKFHKTYADSGSKTLCYSHPGFRKGRCKLLSEYQQQSKDSEDSNFDDDKPKKKTPKKVIKVSPDDTIYASDDHESQITQLNFLLMVHQYVINLNQTVFAPVATAEENLFGTDQEYLDFKKELEASLCFVNF